MKYIKKYENHERAEIKYKEGDYVLINIIKDVTDISNYYVKIISTDRSQQPYLCEFTDGDYYWLTEKNIDRLLTPEEIEIYNIKNDTNKYNL